MGDFAELNVRFRLKSDTPKNVIETLEYMASHRLHVPTKLPEHHLFKTARWESILSSSSDPAGDSSKVTLVEKDTKNESLFIFVRSVYKDRGEAELFFDWIYRYIDALWIEFLGYLKYDNNDHPLLIYFTDEGISFVQISREETENIAEREVEFNWGVTVVKPINIFRNN